MGFAHFLEDMGPRRHDGLTVDRIDTDNPTYGPGLCRWANAVEQANNRTTTTDVYDPREDEWAPRAIVARRHELEPDAIRQAMRRGASAAHVIQQMLDRRAARPSTTPTGRTAAAERPLGEQEAEAAAQAEAAASGHVEPIPDPPVHLASDPVERWPWPLTLAKRVQWEDLFQASRAFFPHGHEWRFEFGIRTARRAWEQHNEALADMLDAWGGEPTLEEEEEYDRLDRRRASLDRHLWEAEARRAAWINDIGNRPRADAPRDRARMLEDHGPDFARLMDETSWRQFMRSTWERRATERREAARTDGYALVHDRRHFHAAPDAGSTSRIKRYALVPVSRQARAPAHPLPTYSAADIMPEPVPMHEDGFPIDDDFREAREWGRRMEAAMQQADAMPPPRVAPVALKPSRQRVPRR
ncbi:MAG: hypothetical protein DI629_12400 [Mesorhizobium amorphae]|nr:MAG: hypothetical protein DI629_12400 [Mesorhizobium amorphae]